MTMNDSIANMMMERYLVERARGEHDDECEVIPQGFWLCACALRSRLAKGITTVPGPLAYVNPICPRCNEHVSYDGEGFVCEDCHVAWSSVDHNDPGEFNDDYGDVAADRAAWLERHPDIAQQMMSLNDPEDEGHRPL